MSNYSRYTVYWIGLYTIIHKQNAMLVTDSTIAFLCYMVTLLHEQFVSNEQCRKLLICFELCSKVGKTPEAS